LRGNNHSVGRDPKDKSGEKEESQKWGLFFMGPVSWFIVRKKRRVRQAGSRRDSKAGKKDERQLNTSVA